jgi:hypothetical protein
MGDIMPGEGLTQSPAMGDGAAEHTATMSGDRSTFSAACYPTHAKLWLLVNAQQLPLCPELIRGRENVAIMRQHRLESLLLLSS